MSVRNFRDPAGSSIFIPVADGDFFISDLATDRDLSDVYFEFYSDAGVTPVTPTAGTITVSGRPQGFQNWLEAVDGTVSASTVSTPNATYTPPTLDGASAEARVNLSGVTGATHFQAMVFKRGS